jgi:hypothetical protein
LRHYIEIRRRLGRVSAARSRAREEHAAADGNADQKIATAAASRGFARVTALRYDRAAIHIRTSEIRNVENQSR